MLLVDVFGYFKRNLNNMKPYEKKKMKAELQRIIDLINQDLSS